MSIKITPGRIESDGHVVLLPFGLTGQVTVEDGTVYDLGPAHEVAIEVDSHDHAREVGLAASQLAAGAGVSDHDEDLSRKNLNLKKKG